MLNYAGRALGARKRHKLGARPFWIHQLHALHTRSLAIILGHSRTNLPTHGRISIEVKCLPNSLFMDLGEKW
jgi:hypothetical protein